MSHLWPEAGSSQRVTSTRRRGLPERQAALLGVSHVSVVLLRLLDDMNNKLPNISVGPSCPPHMVPGVKLGH